MPEISKKKETISSMFNNIAKKYDFLNHFLSMGIDKQWRKKIRKYIKTKKHDAILDVATGTGDLAIELSKLKPKKIYGIDIAEKMIDIGKEKIKNKKLDTIITLQTADALKIPFPDNNFDIVTCAFGVRNFENLSEGLKEILRVLKNKGELIILEFSQPKNKLITFFYKFYFHKILPFIGKKISKDKEAYSYLPASVETFPAGKDLLSVINSIGYKKSKYKTLSFGIASIYICSK